LSVGETTVTLEDVSTLWGLPINGDVVTGDSDTGMWELIETCLGPGKAGEVVYRKNSKGQTIIYEGRISLYLLRMHTEVPGEDAPEEEIQMYTRAYIMDLFGSIVFPDCSGDSISTMYLRFLENLTPDSVPNWGAATLVCLYRYLYF
jgi:hypothetical protein